MWTYTPEITDSLEGALIVVLLVMGVYAIRRLYRRITALSSKVGVLVDEVKTLNETSEYRKIVIPQMQDRIEQLEGILNGMKNKEVT